MSTRVHHLSCATMCPAAARVPGLLPPRLVAHVLLVEGDTGLTLVDSGFGTGDVADPRRLGRAFTKLIGARLRFEDTAVAQVRALGYDPGDVRDVVVTHLDLDHAGGLPDFPRARVHVHAHELAQATARGSLHDRNRYIPAHWAHGPDWVEHTPGGEDWFGFAATKVVSDDVLLVPLAGHTRGHSGVAVRRPSGGWFLHAGDAYFAAGEKQTPPTCPPGLRIFQSLVETDRRERLANQERLRALQAAHGAPGGAVTIFSAHDESELAALADVTD